MWHKNMESNKTIALHIVHLTTSVPIVNTLVVKTLRRNLNFAIGLMAISLDFNSVFYNTFRNLSMIAFIVEIQKSKFPSI